MRCSRPADALLRLPRSRQLVGLKLLGRGVLRAHQSVFSAQGEGEITSGGFSPTLNGSIALARVPVGVRIGDTVEVDIRGKLAQAAVVKYPFVRNGKALVNPVQYRESITHLRDLLFDRLKTTTRGERTHDRKRENRGHQERY